MKFRIVTPSFKRSTYLNETILSVISQEGNFEIDYVVQDGGSGPDVIDILKQWELQISSGQFIPSCKKLTFRWFSKTDDGMYDAINRGFVKSNGDIMAWINTDDLYHSRAFETVSQIFSQFDDVDWITGIPNSFNAYGSRTGWDIFPNAYSREFIKRGYYNVEFLGYGFNWIPQDCCFWRRSLWEKAGEKLDVSKRYAADFYLWQGFAKHAGLVKVNSFLGGYRFHGDQVTANPAIYRSELPKVGYPPYTLKLIHLILKNAPYLKSFLLPNHKRSLFLKLTCLKTSWLWGRTIQWSFTKNKWIIDYKTIF